MTERVYNFSPGPAVLPLKVLEEAQRNLVALPQIGISPLEISHRSPWFEGVLDETEANLRRLLTIPDHYRIVFMQGGSRLQFSLVAMNLLRGSGRSADYVVTGSWGQMAMQEAAREGTARAAYNSKPHNFDRLPQRGELELDPRARYVHITSNETIQGVQFQSDLDAGGVPLVADMSSDFLCRPLDMSRYGLIYACAQKNAGPAGVTIVILRDDVLAQIGEGLPTMLDYRSFVKEKSLINTPPVFAIYLVMLVTRWLLDDVGGLAAMLEINRRKAGLLYEVIDESRGFYRGHAQPNARSLMNVTFRLPDDATQDEFVKQAKARGLVELKGHRSVGGIRASIYNAMPMAGVEKLRDFMREFARL
ncbi:MAG: phosphoserine transaminase [Planctomycetia bacterium 21-64-5]|nr:MAG: phosphoserine transaminase [Planctomycetia bacterium 21-64-5]HQU44877.1 3-phosphoserine/phosphohydroxythreonine transaminase [Pirellulales bacterium]